MENIGQQIPLRPGVVVGTAIGDIPCSKGIPARRGDRPLIKIAPHADDEGEKEPILVGEGDTFLLGDQTWEVIEINNPSSRLWRAIITRVE